MRVRALRRGDRVELRGFGVFNTQKARISRNPKTGESKYTGKENYPLQNV